jgi:hypothetical protein
MVLEDSILSGVDRTVYNLNSDICRTDEKRFSILGKDRVFLPTGNLEACARIEKVMEVFFEDFDPERFLALKPVIQEGLVLGYSEVRRRGIELLRSLGKPESKENVDCLYQGFSTSGRPFMISISSTNNFELQLVDQPYSYVALNQAPEIVSYVQKVLSAFLNEARGKSHAQVWDLAQRFLPGVIQKISKRDPIVSENMDLIFLTREGLKTHEFFKAVGDNGLRGREMTSGAIKGRKYFS